MEKKYKIVYVTICKINGKCYVGSHASNKEIDGYLGSGQAIINAIKKYGRKNFLRINLKFYDTIEKARIDEEYYINLFETLKPKGYNVHAKGGTIYGYSIGMAGKSHSQESRNKIGNYNKNKIISAETRSKISKTLQGHIISNDTIEKIRKKLIKNDPAFCKSCNKKIARPGKYSLCNECYRKTEEYKECVKKFTKNGLGKKHSDEHKRKNSESHKGILKGTHISEDHKKRIGEKNRGKVSWCKGMKMSEEFRKKISESHKGQIPWNKGKSLKKIYEKSCINTEN
jgi:group I intron endonuclease